MALTTSDIYYQLKALEAIKAAFNETVKTVNGAGDELRGAISKAPSPDLDKDRDAFNAVIRALNASGQEISGHMNRLHQHPLYRPGYVPTTAPPVNVGPVVTLTDPATEIARTAPTLINLTAAASHPDPARSIVKVEFYDGTTKLGEVTGAGPYTLTGVSITEAGSHPLTAVATDDGTPAKTATSPVIPLTLVAPALPPTGQTIRRVIINSSLAEGATYRDANQAIAAWGHPGGDWRDASNVSQGPTHYATVTTNLQAAQVITFDSLTNSPNLVALLERLRLDPTGLYLQQLTTTQLPAVFASKENGIGQPIPKVIVLGANGTTYDCPILDDTWLDVSAPTTSRGFDPTFQSPGIIKPDLSAIVGAIASARVSVYAPTIGSVPLTLALDFADTPRVITDPEIELGVTTTGLRGTMSEAALAAAGTTLLHCATTKTAVNAAGFANLPADFNTSRVLETTWPAFNTTALRFGIPAVSGSANGTRVNASTLAAGAGGSITDTTGAVWTMERLNWFSGWEATNPPVLRNGVSVATGYRLLYWNGIVYVQQTSGQWFRVTAPLTAQNLADPSGTEDPAPIVVVPPTPTPVAGSLRASNTEAALRAGGVAGVTYLDFSPTNLVASNPLGFGNFYTHHLDGFQQISGIWFAKHKSIGDGKPFSPTLCSWSKAITPAVDNCWVTWSIIIDPDVKAGLIEEGIKLHGLKTVPALQPGGIAWIGKSSRTTSPARYSIATYEYRTGDGITAGESKRFAPNVFLYEGVVHTVEIREKMNTPGVADGEREMWIDDVQVINDTTVNMRNNSGEHWNSVEVQLFAGGNIDPLSMIHMWSGPMIIHATTRPGMLRL